MENGENMEVIDLIVQPAFCVKDGMIIRTNYAAQQRMVPTGTPIADLISTGAEEYEQFADGCLYLTLKICQAHCGASVTRSGEVDFFVLEQESDQAELRAMALAAMELRGPLANVMAIADQLFPTLESEANEQAARINRGLFQMLRVISNMSDAGRYSTMQSSRQETVNLSAFFDEVFQKAQALMIHTGVTLNFQTLNENIFSLADKEKLERAILNILSNTLKFTPSGGTVTATLTRRGSKLYLSIQDSGSGIAEHLRRTAHSRFLREPSLEDSRFGIGLGMVLIRSTAALHGGTLLIDQPDSGGTRVTMSLQIRQSKNTILRDTNMLRIDYAGERDHGLLELSDSLPAFLYITEGSV